jgi:hypothetical protein
MAKLRAELVKERQRIYREELADWIGGAFLLVRVCVCKCVRVFSFACASLDTPLGMLSLLSKVRVSLTLLQASWACS